MHSARPALAELRRHAHASLRDYRLSTQWLLLRRLGMYTLQPGSRTRKGTLENPKYASGSAAYGASLSARVRVRGIF